MRDAPAVIARHFPEAPRSMPRRLVAARPRIDRVYDPSLAERLLGFRCRTDFAAVLGALERGERIALRPRSLLCLAEGTLRETGDAETGSGGCAGLARR